eukprot:UN30980
MSVDAVERVSEMFGVHSMERFQESDSERSVDSYSVINDIEYSRSESHYHVEEPSLSISHSRNSSLSFVDTFTPAQETVCFERPVINLNYIIQLDPYSNSQPFKQLDCNGERTTKISSPITDYFRATKSCPSRSTLSLSPEAANREFVNLKEVNMCSFPETPSHTPGRTSVRTNEENEHLEDSCTNILPDLPKVTSFPKLPSPEQVSGFFNLS